MLLSSSSPDYWWTSLPYLVIASTKTFFRHSNHFHFLWYLLIQSYCFGVVRRWGWQLASWNPDSQICKLGSVPFLLVTCFALWHDFLSKGTSGLLFACSCTGHPNDFFFFNSAKNEHLRSYWDPMDPHKGAGQSCQSLDSHMDTDLWLTIPPPPAPSIPPLTANEASGIPNMISGFANLSRFTHVSYAVFQGSHLELSVSKLGLHV